MKPQHIAAITVTVILCATALFIYSDYASRSDIATNYNTSATNLGITPTRKAKSNKEILTIQRQIESPGSYIQIEVIGYEERVLKTSRLKLRLTNKTKYVYYDDIMIELRLRNEAGDVTTTKRATFDGRLAPLEDAEFTMYQNGIVSVTSNALSVISASAFVAPDKAEELGIDQ